MLSSSIYHSTAQRNQPCTKQRSKYVPIRVRQPKQADKAGESQHAVEHLFAARNVFSKSTKKSESARPTPLRPQAAGDLRTIFLHSFPISIRYNTRLSPSYIFARCMHAAFRLFWWRAELLAFASRQLAPTSGPLSASFTLFCSNLSL